mmetsp:Transcript_11905/g.34882  ORF Transcript_11905/g.34882 Transcript_11905/m.34882 type:complete len:90 (+) Transcript_11905:156-425(+)
MSCSAGDDIAATTATFDGRGASSLPFARRFEAADADAEDAAETIASSKYFTDGAVERGAAAETERASKKAATAKAWAPDPDRTRMRERC